MKFTRFCILLTIIGLILTVGCASEQSQQPPEEDKDWQEILQTEISADMHPMNTIAFVDEDNGLIGGSLHFSWVYFTTDGGTTWTEAEGSVFELTLLEIADDETVWQCGLNTLGTSSDGGRTWAAKEHKYGSCRLLSAVDADTSWMVAGDSLVATTDGGKTWTEVTLPEGLSGQQIVGIASRSAADGYILDSRGTLFITADGGQNWSSQPVKPITDSEMNLVEKSPSPTGVIHFFDTENGLIVASLAGGGQSKAMALRTADGGQSWVEEDLPAEFGGFHLTHDGTVLTVVDLFNQISVLRYQ
jgi:photosystem II stability/assembly factor-like uncharacterized protein